MNLTTLFGKLLPSNPEINQAIETIRKRYNLPEISAGDGLAEIIAADDEFDFSAIKNDLEQEIRDNKPFGDESIIRLYNLFKENGDGFPDFEGLETLPQEKQDEVNKLYHLVLGLLIPTFQQLDGMYQHVINAAFEFLLTGETRDVPEEWFGQVFVASSLGSPIIYAIANGVADPQEIAKQFTAKHRQVFGTENRKITAGKLNSADYLRMRFQGMQIKDIADVYIERHPSEFPADPLSKSYRQSKAKLEERLKKRLQRTQETINSLVGDTIE